MKHSKSTLYACLTWVQVSSILVNLLVAVWWPPSLHKQQGINHIWRFTEIELRRAKRFLSTTYSKKRLCLVETHVPMHSSAGAYIHATP